MLSRLLVAASLGMALTATAMAQTPRTGGTIRFTAPYGSSFSSMDIHTTQRAQDDIYAKGLHRSLYTWDSAKGEPALELAKEVTVSDDGMVYTFKLRDDAYFHHGK
jgi:peptide/nickel transport system substrate-binding protein